MKEEIEAWNKSNGNNNYTQRDIIVGIMAKLEKIDDRLIEGEKRFVSKGLLWRISSGLFALLGALSYYTIIFRGGI